MFFFQRLILSLSISFFVSQGICQELPDEKETLNIAIDSIFEHLGEDSFNTKLAELEKLGAAKQVLLEFEFLHNIETRNTSALAKMATKLKEHKDLFDPGISQIFATKEDWLSIVHYTKALAALEQEDDINFKKNITEAFWLSPQQAQIFEPHIEAHRLKKAMANLNFDFSISLPSQANNKPSKLDDIIGDSPAILLHFWSPLSEQVQINAEDFVATSITCAEHKIPTASILLGQDKEILTLAESFRKNEATKAKCYWLLDLKKDSLANHLKISKLPTMVIISSKGKVLFNGAPSDERFWHTLSNIKPQIKRPNKPNDPTNE